MLRQFSGNFAFVNGTTIAAIGQCPAPIRIRRILVGSAVATDFSGNLDVIALASGSDLDTAAATGNKLISTMTAFADKKLNSQTLTSNCNSVAKDSVIVVSVAHNAILGTGLVNVIVEYDVIGGTYGAYDAGDASEGTYA